MASSHPATFTDLPSEIRQHILFYHIEQSTSTSTTRYDPVLVQTILNRHARVNRQAAADVCSVVSHLAIKKEMKRAYWLRQVEKLERVRVLRPSRRNDEMAADLHGRLQAIDDARATLMRIAEDAKMVGVFGTYWDWEKRVIFGNRRVNGDESGAREKTKGMQRSRGGWTRKKRAWRRFKILHSVSRAFSVVRDKVQESDAVARIEDRDVDHRVY